MKKHVALLALSAAALLGLGSCGDEGIPSINDGDVSSIIDGLKVNLTIDAPEGVKVTVTNAPEDEKYFGGETVTFKVEEDIVDKDVATVKADGLILKANDEGEYTFVMPNKDTEIKVELKTLGDADILKVTDVDEDDIPTLAADKYTDQEAVKAFTTELDSIAKNSDALQTNYLREMTFNMKSSPVGDLFKEFGAGSSTYEAQGKVYATKNKEMKLEYKARTGVGQTTYMFEGEKGFKGEDVYFTRFTEYRGSNGSYGYQVTGQDDEMHVYDVVPDNYGKEGNPAFDAKTMMKETDANDKGTTFGIATLISAKLYKGTTSSSLSFFGTGGKVYNQILNVKTTVADDKKTYTLEITSADFSYIDAGYFTAYTNTLTVDGDGFIRKIACVVDKYNADAYAEADNKIADDAVPTSTTFVNFELTRGFKHDDVVTTNIADYVMNDFDVELKVNRSWASTDYVSTLDGPLTIEAGAEIQSVNYYDYIDKTGLIFPKFLGAEDESFFTVKTSSSGNTYTVIKAGTTNLLFDNWNGVIKSFPVTFTEPDPFKITASLDKKVVEVGETITLTAAITPEAANQEMTVELDPANPTQATLVKNDDGTYTITPTKVGNSFVRITSVKKPSVTMDVLFAVPGPATYDGLMAYLPTVTFANTSAKKPYSDFLNVNFNADGTGSTMASNSSGSSKYGNVAPFTWTLDPETLEFTITQTTAADTNILTGFKALNSASFTMMVSTGNKDAVEYELLAGPRVNDMAVGPWLNVSELEK